MASKQDSKINRGCGNTLFWSNSKAYFCLKTSDLRITMYIQQIKVKQTFSCMNMRILFTSI